MSTKITYDDTRDIAIRLVDKLSHRGFIKPNQFDDWGEIFFEVQDTIQYDINELLGLDIDDNFTITINNKLNQREMRGYEDEDDHQHTCEEESCRSLYSGDHNGGLCARCSD